MFLRRSSAPSPLFFVAGKQLEYYWSGSASRPYIAAQDRDSVFCRWNLIHSYPSNRCKRSSNSCLGCGRWCSSAGVQRKHWCRCTCRRQFLLDRPIRTYRPRRRFSPDRRSSSWRLRSNFPYQSPCIFPRLRLVRLPRPGQLDSD